MEVINKWRKSKPVKLILLAGLVLFVVLRFEQVAGLFNLIIGIIMPLFVGVIIAYILNLIVKVFEKYYFPRSKRIWVNKMRKPVCVVLACLLVILILLFVITLITPQIISILRILGTQIPVLYEKIISYANQTLRSYPEIQNYLPELPDDIDQKIFDLLSNMTGGALNIAGSAIGSVIGFVISIVFAMYLLFARDALLRKFNKAFSVYLTEHKRERIYSIFGVANNVFSKFFIGQAIEAFILGSLCTIGMLVIGFPYAGMIGAVVGITALIPVVGAYIGGIVGFTIIFTENIYQAIGFVVFLIILQQFESGLIYPKVVGTSVGLPGIFVFASVIIGGGLFGIPGVLFGVPITATIYKLLQKDVSRKLIKTRAGEQQI